MCRLFVFLISIGLLQVRANIIQQVDDSDLVHLLTGEENVVVLFTKNNCKECDDLESVLEKIQNELKEDIRAVVVKAHNSHMVGLYNPSKEPALIFFRRGMPLLYHGLPNAEEIVQLFIENIEPTVKELSDINFEHLTQAATGSTTGDWFLFFYSPDCVFCLRLHAIWEAVGARLKHRLNLARIDRTGAGLATAKRFGIIESPEFIFIRQGKVYRYKKKEYTARSFIEFVENDFVKQTNPEIVPPESNDISTILTGFINFMENTSQFRMLSIIGVFLLVIIGSALIYISFKRSNIKHTSKAKKAK